MSLQGQVYIPVEADETTPMLMNAGMSGQAEALITVLWNSQGVTGTYGWPAKMPIIEINDTAEDISRKLVQGIEMTYPTKSSKLEYLFSIGNCSD